MCKLMCCPTYYASVWLSDNLWLMSTQLNADKLSLAFSAFAQTDVPQYLTEITKNRISISEFGTFSLTFSFSYHVSWSFLSSLTEYLNVLCSITLKNTSSFLKHCLLLPGGLLLSQKLPSFPFLQLLKMGAVRLRLTTDLLSRGSFQFSELCYSLLAVLDSALNIWPYTNTVGSYVHPGVTHSLLIVE